MSLQVGLEIAGARLIAVLIDAEGRVHARAEAAAAVDAATAGRDLVEQVTSGKPAPVAIAATSPDSPGAAALLAALGNGGRATAPTILASGSAAAVAESWVGAAKGSRSVAFLSAGEHTTGGIVRDGVPLVGARGRAMSVAWLSLNPVEREDYRKTGCLEAEVAAAGIVRRLVWRIKTGDSSRVSETVGHDLSAITIEHIFRAAREGDGVAISVVRDTAKYLGMAAANLVAIADPETLVLGGMMATAADLLLDQIRSDAQRRLPRVMADALVVVPAALGDDAAAIGAAHLAARATA